MIIASQSAPEALSRATGWWEMGSRFREGGTALEPANLLIFLAVVSAIAVALWLVSRFFQRDRDQPYHGPRRLFLRLCREHQLNASERWLLWRLAQAHELQQPASVFVDRRHFETEALPQSWRNEEQRLGQLRERLFGYLN